MAGVARDISIVGGRAYFHTVYIEDDEGNPYVFDEDDTFAAQVRPTATSKEKTDFEIEVEGNAVTLSLPASTTQKMAQGGVWDLVVYPEGNPELARTLVAGTATWRQGVTR